MNDFIVNSLAVFTITTWQFLFIVFIRKLVRIIFILQDRLTAVKNVDYGRLKCPWTDSMNSETRDIVEPNERILTTPFQLDEKWFNSVHILLNIALFLFSEPELMNSNGTVKEKWKGV